jgi:hypothetical protein
VLGLGLLRRLLIGSPGEAAEPAEEPGEAQAAERIEAARRRLKETIPPPQDDAP